MSSNAITEENILMGHSATNLQHAKEIPKTELSRVKETQPVIIGAAINNEKDKTTLNQAEGSKNNDLSSNNIIKDNEITTTNSENTIKDDKIPSSTEKKDQNQEKEIPFEQRLEAIVDRILDVQEQHKDNEDFYKKALQDIQKEILKAEEKDKNSTVEKKDTKFSTKIMFAAGAIGLVFPPAFAITAGAALYELITSKGAKELGSKVIEHIGQKIADSNKLSQEEKRAKLKKEIIGQKSSVQTQDVQKPKAKAPETKTQETKKPETKIPEAKALDNKDITPEAKASEKNRSAAAEKQHIERISNVRDEKKEMQKQNPPKIDKQEERQKIINNNQEPIVQTQIKSAGRGL